MAQKYYIYHETGWDEHNNEPIYKKLTTLKNEQSAIAFIHDLDNIGKYGNMIAKTTTSDGKAWEYNDRKERWQSE